MRILDRYLIREYIRTFAVILLSLSVVFIVIDIIDNLPRLMRFGATFNQAVLYYLLRLPYLIILTSPVTMLLTGLFLMNSLAKYNESVAIRAAGISIKRAMLPLFGLGLLMSLVIGMFGEYVLPKSEETRSYVYRVLIRDEQPEDQMLKSRIHYQGKDGRFFYFGYFDGYKNTLRVIDIVKFDSAKGEVTERISASAAEWKYDQWVLRDCEIRTFKDNLPIEWKHYQTSVLPVMDVHPRDFIRITKKTLSMNFLELYDYIERLKRTGDDYTKELVDLHFKIAYPLTNLIVIFFFIPIATSNIRSKGRGWIFMLGLVVCFLFLTILRISQSLGYNQILPPVIAAWGPNALFTMLGFIFLRKAEI